MSYNYSASQVPIPMVPTAPPSVAACTDSTTTAAMYVPLESGEGVPALGWNQNCATTAAAFAFGGGYGVIQGFVLSTVSGLALPIGAGVANCNTAVPYAGGTQVVPDNTTLGFLWLLQNGTTTPTTTITPPSSNCVYIGNFTTSGGNVTAVDYSGVCYCIGGNLIRTTNDRSAPADTPSAGTYFHTITQAGHYVFNGSNYFNLNPVSTSYTISATLSGNYTAIPQDNGCTFFVDPSGSTYKFILPNPADVPYNWSISINNSGSSGSIQVYDYTGTTTLYCTLTTTNTTIAPFTTKLSGAVAFPAGPWTPGKPTPSPAPGPTP
jgi:hypothetical protein